MKKVKLTPSLIKRLIKEEKAKIEIEKKAKAILERKRLNTYIRLIKSIKKSQASITHKDIVLEGFKRKLIKKIKRSL
jgi:hypothetical protein